MARRKASIQSNQPIDEEIFAVVSGSFNRFLPQIREAMRSMIALGITVLSPRTDRDIGICDRFVILEGDKGSPGQIEKRHLQAISKSDFLYVVNPEGYIGESVALEIGYALSKGIPIYALAPARERVFSSFISSGLSLEDIKKTVSQRKKNLAKLPLKSSPTLTDLQKYVSAMVRKRGFSEEGLIEVVLLFVEEVGELAKAIRFDQGLKCSSDAVERVKSIGSELADCLIYLLDLANLANVELEKAMREKEAVNSEKKWQKRTEVSQN